MVDARAPLYYFQVSPANDRIATVMAEFAAYSEEIGEVATGKDGRRAAVLVYDPDDEYFSADLQEKFTERYQGGKVIPIAYRENPSGQVVTDVARNICGAVRDSGGFILYAGRSGGMPQLFDSLQDLLDCRKADGKPIAVFAESMDAKYMNDPVTMLKQHAVLRPFYVMPNDSNGTASPGSPYSEFTSVFRNVFKDSTVPEANAAGAYDALRVASEMINQVYAVHKTPQNSSSPFQSTDVAARLSNPGVQDFAGASGWLSLDSRHKYPSNKALYVMQPHLDRTVTTLMACGLLPDRPRGLNNPATWGGPGKKRPCPMDAS
jgi:hypothetical protein